MLPAGTGHYNLGSSLVLVIGHVARRGPQPLRLASHPFRMMRRTADDAEFA